MQLAAGRTTNYTYDAPSRLIGYEYDGGGNLVATAINLAPDRPRLQPMARPRLKAALNQSRKKPTSYTYGTYIDEPLAMYRPGQTNLYYSRDGRYDVAALTDSGGNVVERYKYEAFGKATVRTPGVDGVWGTGDDVTADSSQVGNPWTFTGRRLDDESGLYYFRNRMWNGGIGRFNHRDPAGFTDGYNLYPGYFVPDGMDPTGLGFWDSVVEGADAALDAGASFAEGMGNALTGGATGPLSRDLGDSISQLASDSPQGQTNYRENQTAQILGDATGKGVLAGLAMTGAAEAAGLLEDEDEPTQAPTPTTQCPNTPTTTTPSTTAPSDPVGRSGSPMQGDGNAPTTIDGRDYSGHAIDQMQNRGIPSSAVENTVQTGTPSPGNTAGTTVYSDPVNNLSVPTDTQSGRVITVIPKAK